MEYNNLSTNEKKIVSSATQLKQIQSSLAPKGDVNKYINLLSKL